MKRLALAWAILMCALGVLAGCAGVRAPGPAPTSSAELPAPKQLQPRQIIVALAAQAREQSSAVKQALATEYGIMEMGSFPLGSIGVECVVFQVAPGRSLPELIARLAGDPRVALAQQNQVFRGMAEQPAEPAAGVAYAAALIHADAARRTRTGKGIRVAVIDTGVATDHPGLHDRIVATKNFVDGGERTFERDQHGTAVVGVIAADGHGARVQGIAPGAEILAIKACWYAGASEGRALCSSWTLAKALDFAIAAGAQIVNMSLSGPADGLLTRLIARAHERGMITVAAALEEGDAPGFPASLPQVLAVLASDDHGRVRVPAWTARATALAAPGLDILTTVPGDGWDFLSGSSLAAAHVSGVVALLLEQSPQLTAGEVLDVLKSTAHAVPRDVRGPATEVGLVDACAALARLMRVASCP